ncbi:MAG TPA: DUF2254 domain-containing protein, partial [Nocardioidaceae bacterium]
SGTGTTSVGSGMGTRITYLADYLRNSYWFTPGLMLLGSALLAWVTVRIDEAADPENLPWVGSIIYSGGSNGAHEVLGTISSSMITVAGVVFSITIVTLQLASSQFGPRMLATFMRDRGNQVTLGTFVATFLYSLLVLRTIRSDDPSSVPHLSVTIALGLAVAGLAVLIYFIHHVSTIIQAPNLVQTIAGELHRSTDHMFPDVEEMEDARSAEDHARLPADFDARSRQVKAAKDGYVQVIDVERLVAVGREHDLVIRLDTRGGRFVVHHTAFAVAYPAERVTDEVVEAIADALVTGARRTAQQDIEFPLKQMVEIAVRALSPGINDPFTASTCVDQIGAGLCRLASRELPSPHVLDADGALRVVHGDPVTWERLVGAGFDQIRQCADFHTPVYLHVLESLAQIAGCVRDETRLEPLLREARLVVEAAERNVEAEADHDVIEQRYDDLLTVVERARTTVPRR